MGNLFADRSAASPKSLPAVMGTRSAAPKIYLVEVYNGAKRSEEKFASGEEK